MKEQDKADAWAQMFFLKKILPGDVAFMVKRNSWVAGTIYDQYDPAVDLTQKNFFIITTDRKVYKCLDNGSRSPSTVVPTLTITTPFETSDGYKWKFMFDVSQAVLDKFSTESLIPVQANTTIENSSVSGTVDGIKVAASGNNWIAHDDGLVLGTTANNVYRISVNAVAANDYYTTSGFYVKDGPGSGFLSQIASYTTNSSGNFVTLTTGNPGVAFGSHYYISPYVSISGDGQGATAYSIVDNNTATISGVRVLNSGNNYTWSKAVLAANSLYSNSLCSIVPTVSPLTGHGSRPISELYSSAFCVATKIANTDNIQSNVTCRTIGVVVQPVLTTNTLATSNSYQQSSSMSVTSLPGSSYTLAPGEIITGSQSRARALVLTANSTKIAYTNTISSFIAGETAVSNTTTSTFTINSTLSGPIKQFTGNTVYLSNIQPINIDVSGASREIVKIIIGV
jgi:hypothetical protein